MVFVCFFFEGLMVLWFVFVFGKVANVLNMLHVSQYFWLFGVVSFLLMWLWKV